MVDFYGGYYGGYYGGFYDGFYGGYYGAFYGDFMVEFMGDLFLLFVFVCYCQISLLAQTTETQTENSFFCMIIITYIEGQHSSIAGR